MWGAEGRPEGAGLDPPSITVQLHRLCTIGSCSDWSLPELFSGTTSKLKPYVHSFTDSFTHSVSLLQAR